MTAAEQRLLEAIRQDAPAPVLLVAPGDSALAQASPPSVDVVHCAAAVLDIDRRYRLAVLSDSLESLPLAEAEAVLARLRDLIAQRVLLRLRDDNVLDGTQLAALGYRVLHREAQGLLAGYDPYDYKDRPDWLNARYWAHPERWDAERW